MNFGNGGIIIQTRDQVGSPFPAGSANNGLSVDPITGKIVLGNDTGGNTAALLNDREIPIPSNQYIRFTQNGSLSNYCFIAGQNVPGGFPIMGSICDFNGETNLLYAANTNTGLNAKTFLGLFNNLGNNLTFGITGSNNNPSVYGQNQPVIIAQGPNFTSSLNFSAQQGFHFIPATIDPAGETLRINQNGAVEINPSGIFANTGESLQVTDGINLKSGNFLVVGTSTNTIEFTNTTTAPPTTATPTFANYYGGNTNALGDPAGWILITVAGTDQKIPFYNI